MIVEISYKISNNCFYIWEKNWIKNRDEASEIFCEAIAKILENMSLYFIYENDCCCGKIDGVSWFGEKLFYESEWPVEKIQEQLEKSIENSILKELNFLEFKVNNLMDNSVISSNENLNHRKEAKIFEDYLWFYLEKFGR